MFRSADVSFAVSDLSTSDPTTVAKPSAGKRRVRRTATIVSTAAVVLIALVVICAVDSYTMLGSSMRPTYDPGARIFVNRFATAEVGDIVVAPSPLDGDRIVIKRVVAAGGDTFAFTDCQVELDGKVVVDPLGGGDSCGGGVAEMTIPPGHVFVLGDNRGASEDSRDFGTIAADQIVGVAIRW